jgi:Flp pilus assembly protein TadD
LINALGYKDLNVRNKATEVLVKIGDARAIKPLTKDLEDSNSLIRINAVMTLKKIGDKRAVEPLINALKSKDKNIRKKAAEALGKLGDKQAVEPLTEALQEKDKDVRHNAAEALGKIVGKTKDKSVRQKVEKALKSYRVLGVNDNGRAEESADEVGKSDFRRLSEKLLDSMKRPNWQPQAVQIGHELYKSGGQNAVMFSFMAAKISYGDDTAKLLSICWNGIRGWASDSQSFIASSLSETAEEGETVAQTWKESNLLGLEAQQRGDYEQAIKFFEEAVELASLESEYTPGAAASLANLAFTFESISKYEKAESKYKKALRISEKACGENHPQTGSILNLMGQFYFKRDDLIRAKELIDRAYFIEQSQQTDIEEQLLQAARGSSEESTRLVKELLTQGVDIECRNEDADTPLMCAAWAGNVDTVKLLIDAGAEVNVHNWEGKTPLMATAIYGHYEATKILLAFEADVSAIDSYGCTAEYYARSVGNDNIARIFT